MNRQRYEPVPQREREEPIILSSIHNSPSYNYNSAIPNSVASSSHTPSIIAPSIPSSPPPSFHTHSSPGTPRPTPGTTDSSRQSYAELWGVAPSTVGGETEMMIGTSNDALATIAGLKQRVESLEETVGRLLLERDNAAASGTNDPDRAKRDNCCVTFTDASPDLEQALTRSSNNCCVTFRSSNAKKTPGLLVVKMVVVCALFIVIVLTVLLVKLADANASRVLAGQALQQIHHQAD